jgi:hypothetical protein
MSKKLKFRHQNFSKSFNFSFFISTWRDEKYPRAIIVLRKKNFQTRNRRYDEARSLEISCCCAIFG